MNVSRRARPPDVSGSTTLIRGFNLESRHVERWVFLASGATGLNTRTPRTRIVGCAHPRAPSAETAAHPAYRRSLDLSVSGETNSCRTEPLLRSREFGRERGPGDVVNGGAPPRGIRQCGAGAPEQAGGASRERECGPAGQVDGCTREQRSRRWSTTRSPPFKNPQTPRAELLESERRKVLARCTLTGRTSAGWVRSRWDRIPMVIGTDQAFATRVSKRPRPNS